MLLRPLALTLLLLASTLAGCIDVPPEGSPQNEAAPAPTAIRADASTDGWPDPDRALLRPGVQWGDSRSGIVGVYETEGVVALCTANFVFRSPDNASLFLGTSAHCVDDLEIGDPVAFAFGEATGTLHYDAWKLLEERGEFDPRTDRDFDFALLRVDDAHRHLVHPAMYHFGGPIGLTTADELTPGEGILTYGNSSLHANRETLRRNEGCVSHVNSGSANLRTLLPVVPGDSGSPVVTSDGRALGIMSEVGSLQEDVPRGNIVATLLAPNLELARSAGIDVQLVTWPLLAGATAPTHACP